MEGDHVVSPRSAEKNARSLQEEGEGANELEQTKRKSRAKPKRREGLKEGSSYIHYHPGGKGSS